MHLQRGRVGPTLACSMWKLSAGPSTNAQLCTDWSLCCPFFIWKLNETQMWCCSVWGRGGNLWKHGRGLRVLWDSTENLEVAGDTAASGRTWQKFCGFCGCSVLLIKTIIHRKQGFTACKLFLWSEVWPSFFSMEKKRVNINVTK